MTVATSSLLVNTFLAHLEWPSLPRESQKSKCGLRGGLSEFMRRTLGASLLLSFLQWRARSGLISQTPQLLAPRTTRGLGLKLTNTQLPREEGRGILQDGSTSPRGFCCSLCLLSSPFYSLLE